MDAFFANYIINFMGIRKTLSVTNRFEDPEGLYVPKDTVLTDLRERNIIIKLDPLQ